MDWNVHSHEMFKRWHGGLTRLQYKLLSEAENGKIRRKDIGAADVITMHYLSKRGIVEYVKTGTGSVAEGVWWLTDSGHKLMRDLNPSDGQGAKVREVK